MSKYGTTIIIVILAALIIFSGWYLVSGYANSRSDDLGVKAPEEGVEKVTMTFNTDKDSYKSKDVARLEVRVISNKDIEGLMLDIEGMKNNYSEDYIEEKKEISLQTNKEEVYIYEIDLPACSSCSGFSEGEYEVVAKVLKGGYTMAEEKVAFNLSQ